MQALQVRSQSRNMSWWRKWHPTYVFLDRKSHGQRCLAGCSWGGKDSDTTQWRNYWGGNPHLEYQPSFRITTFCLLPLLSCLNSFCSPLTTSVSAILLSHPIFRNLSCLEKGNLSCLSRKVLKTGKSVLYIKYSEQCPCPQPLEETPLSPHEECWINPVLLLWVPLPVSFCSRSFYNKPKHTDSKP